MQQLFYENLSVDTELNSVKGQWNFVGFEGYAGEQIIINGKTYTFSEGKIYNRSSPTLLEFYDINITSIKCGSNITKLNITIFG